MYVSELLCYACISQLDRLQFLTALFLEAEVFWSVTQCWMSSYLCFESLYCLWSVRNFSPIERALYPRRCESSHL